MKKRARKGLHLLICVLVLTVCLVLTVQVSLGKADKEKLAAEQDGELTEDVGKPVIGVTLASESASYQEGLGGLLIQDSEKDGEYELELCYAQWNAKTQEEQMRSFIEEDVAAIILCPVNAKSLLNALRDAKKAGIPVINLNMKVDMVSTEYVAAYVGASMSEEADLAAEMVADYFDGKGGKIGIIEGSQGCDPQIYRTDSFLEYLSAYPEIEVVGLMAGDWSREKAAQATQTLLSKQEDIDLLYCHDAYMAMGAYETLQNLGLEEQIKLVAIGDAEEYRDAVLDGRIYGLVDQSMKYEAGYAWKCAKWAAEGKKLRSWYKNPVSSLTIDNVEEYVPPWQNDKDFIS